jgi:hypothetical protein
MIGGVLLYILCIAAVGYYAATLNRSSIGWGLASVILSPFLASLLLLILGHPEES